MASISEILRIWSVGGRKRGGCSNIITDVSNVTAPLRPACTGKPPSRFQEVWNNTK